MNGAVGVRWAVVQDVCRPSFARLSNLAVNVHFFPFFQPFRLVLRQIGLHGKSGLRQIQSCFKVERGPHVFIITGGIPAFACYQI